MQRDILFVILYLVVIWMETQEYEKTMFDYMDVSLRWYSLLRLMIPFLQNDDANLR